MLKTEHTIVAVNLVNHEQLTPEFKVINPLGTVPALKTVDNQIIWQSLAIIDYVDRAQQLLPRDPLERARCIQITQTIVSDIQPLQNLAVTKQVEKLAGEQAKNEWAVFHNQSKLKIINDRLVNNDSRYCVGNEVTLADVCLVPQLYSASRFGIHIKSEFPRLFAIAKRLEKLDAFRSAHPHAQLDCPADIRSLGLEF